MIIKDLNSKGFRLGNGLIIKYKGKFLFAIGKNKFWKKENGKLVITYTGVGGKLEKEENFIDSSIREAKEEIDSAISIKSDKKTLFYDFNKNSKKIIHLKEKIKPAIIYRKSNEYGRWFVCIYNCSLKSEPKPSSEIPALILLKKKQIYEEKSLKELLNEGAEIIEKEKIPRNAILRPYGSAEILKDRINEVFIHKIIKNQFR